MLSRRGAVAVLAAAGVLSSARAQEIGRETAREKTQEKTSAPLRTLHARAASAALGGRGNPLHYEGSAPGPVLRVRQREELRVRLVNELAEATTVHWHGLRLPNAMDGVAHLTQPPVEAGESFEYRFRPPDAGTFWYHAHSAEQADAGLYGALIVEEREAVDADRDVVLVLGLPDAGERSQLPVLNGVVQPDIPVQPGERLRLRIINAAAARGVSLKLEGHAAWVMALDGQPVEPFLARESRVGLAPGSRVDLFVDATASVGAVAPILSGMRDDTTIARLVYEGSGRPGRRSASQPAPLPSNPLPRRIDLKDALRADVAIGGGAPPSAAPLLTVSRGRAVSLGLQNRTARPQAVHVHGHHFRLLDRLDDGWKPYWLDTLVVGELGERIAFVADNPGKWLIESRVLDSGSGGTAVWFAVT